jgi:predicted RNA-binding Zn ribbon-like protein
MPGHDGRGSLRWVEELINTRSVESGTDEIATPVLLATWLRDRFLLPAGVSVTSDEHQRAIRAREGLRALAAANGAKPEPADHARGDRLRRRGLTGSALADLAGLARRLPLVLDTDARPPRLVPVSRGTADAVLAALLAAVAESVANGTWNRLKVCREPDCRWAYFDHSRNRSRAWCSMTVCGNRAKAKAFRRRAR